MPAPGPTLQGPCEVTSGVAVERIHCKLSVSCRRLVNDKASCLRMSLHAMFHSRGGRGGESSSSSTRSSFHTANSSNLCSNDEIQTILESSSSEIPSLVLGQRSLSSGRSASRTEDYESHYSTAKSSLDSKYRSDTFYTATSQSRSRTGDYSSSLYSSEFESDDSGSATESNVDEFENDDDAERYFLKAKLKSLRREKQKIQDAVEPDKDGGSEAEKEKFIEKQLALLLQRKKEALPELPQRKKNMKNDKRFKQRSGLPDPAVLVPSAVVDRLRIQNMLYHMKQVSQAPDHEIDHCESCRKMKESVLEKEFMKAKHCHVYNQLTEDRYRQHIVTHDPLSEIGNLASALPKLSTDPEKIWNNLLQNGVT